MAGPNFLSRKRPSQGRPDQATVSRRMKDKFDIFGGLPDTIEDDWIESVERLEEMMLSLIHISEPTRPY